MPASIRTRTFWHDVAERSLSANHAYRMGAYNGMRAVDHTYLIYLFDFLPYAVLHFPEQNFLVFLSAVNDFPHSMHTVSKVCLV